MSALQRSPEWFEQRASLVTASVCAAALGQSKYKKRDELLHEKVLAMAGVEPEFKGNQFTRWGTDSEKTAKNRLEDVLDTFISASGLVVHPNFPWLAASPDGVISPTRGVEIKCPYHPKFPDMQLGLTDEDSLDICESKLFQATDRIDYFIQMQIQMAVCGFDDIVFCCWTPLAMHHEILKRDDQFLHVAIPQLKLFHDDMMHDFNDEEKRADHLKGVQSYTKNDVLLTLAADYTAQYQRVKTAESRLSDLKDRLIKEMESSEALQAETPALKIKFTTRRGKLNSTALQKAAEESGINVDSFRGEADTAWTVSVKQTR